MMPSIKEDLNYLLARVRPDLPYQRKIKQKGDAWSVTEWLAWKELSRSSHSKPLPWGPGCSGPPPTWFQMSNASPYPLLGWELSTCWTQSNSPECQDFRAVLSSVRGICSAPFLALLSSLWVNVHFCTPCVQPGDSWGAGGRALPGHPRLLINAAAGLQHQLTAFSQHWAAFITHAQQPFATC